MPGHRGPRISRVSDRAGDTAADGTSAMTELVEARQARAERDGLHERRVVVGRLIADAETQLRQAEDRQRLEQTDVVKLESLSLTRILTGLKGNRDTELQRERAEAEAAAYEVGVAQARLDGIRADLAAVEHRLAALGDVDRRWERAVAVRADELTASGDPVGARLDELGETVGACSAELAQIGEASMAPHWPDLARPSSFSAVRSRGRPMTPSSTEGSLRTW